MGNDGIGMGNAQRFTKSSLGLLFSRRGVKQGILDRRYAKGTQFFLEIGMDRILRAVEYKIYAFVKFHKNPSLLS